MFDKIFGFGLAVSLSAASVLAMSPVSEPSVPMGKTGLVRIIYPKGVPSEVAMSINRKIALYVGNARFGKGLDRETAAKLPPMPLPPFWGETLPGGAHLLLNFVDSKSENIKNTAISGGGMAGYVTLNSLETRDVNLYEQRVTKAVLSSVGKIIGVNPCEDKKCVMHGDVGSTKDTDFKNSDFCPACLKLFCAAVITRELWITPIGGFSGPNSQY